MGKLPSRLAWPLLRYHPNLLARIAEISKGQDLTGQATAVFAHNLPPPDRAARSIWMWLTLLAILLLPVDIAVRRLVITRRDWERAWAATFGRFGSGRVVEQPRPEPMSRLFQAKQRAGIGSTGPEAEEGNAPPPILRQDASQAAPASQAKASETQAAPARPRPTPRPAPPTTPPPAGGSLASRLLKKKRDEAEEQEK